VRRLPIAHQRLAYALAPANAVNAVAFVCPFRALAMVCQYLA
jgi:hypothetical protein